LAINKVAILHQINVFSGASGIKNGRSKARLRFPRV
jgi:hypothetical protein